MEKEVIVIGGGPAGIAAAWSAAKNGSKVLLIERYVIQQEVGPPHKDKDEVGPRFSVKTYCLSQNQNYITYINNSIFVHIC